MTAASATEPSQALAAAVTAARPAAPRSSPHVAEAEHVPGARTLFVTRESAHALARQVAAVRRGADGGVDMRDIPMQQVELQPCDPATQDCKELEWVFRIEKPDFSTPAAPRRTLKEAGGEAGAAPGAGASSGDGSGDGSGDTGMVESVMSWFGGSGGDDGDDGKGEEAGEPTAAPGARPPLVPPVADDEFGAWRQCARRPAL